MLTLILLLLAIGAVGILFSSAKISPVPYFPSNRKDEKHIINLLHLRNDQTILDLGAGDGWIIFKAASVAYGKKLNTQFIAVEINPILISVLWIHKIFHTNRKHIHIIWGDFLKLPYSQFLPKDTHALFYFYATPWLTAKIATHLQKTMKTYEAISYMYPLPYRCDKEIHGIHPLYYYKMNHGE